MARLVKKLDFATLPLRGQCVPRDQTQTLRVYLVRVFSIV